MDDDFNDAAAAAAADDDDDNDDDNGNNNDNDMMSKSHALPAVSYYLQPAHGMHLSGLAGTRTHRTLFSRKPS